MKSLEEIKNDFAVCKSVKIEKDEDGDVRISVRRTGTSYGASIAQVRYLESFDNYVGKISHSKMMKVHGRVMSTIIDEVKNNPSINFYLSI